jgi:HicB family
MASEAEQEQATETTHSGRLMLRMPPTLHSDLAEAAQREGVSLNTFILGVLAGAVAWRAPEGATGADRGASPRWTRRALTANLIVVALLGAIAIALLVVSLIRGW